MLKKGSKLYSILTGSCPKCHQESMYIVKNPYKLNSLFKMNEKCGHCNLRYQIEPSFFYGAMYVNYGLTIAVGIAIFIIANLILKLNINSTFLTLIIGLVVLMPILSRFSRNIYINMFIGFDKNWKQNS